MAQLTLYHNPRCSKSREALRLLRERGEEPELIEYLKTPPDAKELRRLLRLLGKKPSEVVRTGESVYRELNLGGADEDALLAAIAKHPILLERPVAVAGKTAVIGRPPETVLDLL